MKKTTLVFAMAISLGCLSLAPGVHALEKPTLRLADLSITDKQLGSVVYGLESIEHWIGKMESGDASRAKTLSRDLNRQINRLTRIKGADETQLRKLQDYIDTVAYFLQQAEAGLVSNGDIASGVSSTVAAPTVATAGQNAQGKKNIVDLASKLERLQSTFDSPRVSGMQLQQNFDRLVQKFEALPVSADREYTTLFDRFVEVGQLLVVRNPDIGMSLEDASSKVAELQEKYRDVIPVVNFESSGELTPEAVDDYIGQLQTVSADRDRDLPVLRAIVSATGNGGSLLTWLETTAIEEVQRSHQRFDQTLKSTVGYRYSQLEKLASLDPIENAYAFGDENKRQQNEKAFAIVLRTLQQAAVLQSQLGTERTYADSAEHFSAMLDTWRAKFDQAKTGRELPVDIANDELRLIAETVLVKEKYGVGDWQKIIVNADIRPGESNEHKMTPQGLETIIKRWDEYQVATVELENGKYYLYYNTLRNFSRAPRTTPVNQWILTKRHKSGEINAELIH